MSKLAKKKQSKLGLSSANEDGFPTSSRENKSDALNSGSKTEDRDNGSVVLKNQKKKEKDGKKLKRKIDAVSQDEEPTRDNNEPHDSVLPDAANSENEMKQKKNKKNKKKKVTEKEENAEESGMANSDGTESSPVATNVKQTPDTKNEKKKKNKQNKQQDGAATPNTEEKLADKKTSAVEKKEKADAKPLQKIRKFRNGLVVEKLVIGKPDAKRASRGTKVGVRYVGKLKQNGKIFDSNIEKALPFKFRLGIGKVIKGLDVGINGMRVGDKRRLTIPPALGYGTKGCDRPAIPRNSWLVYDVELVDVH